jgi:hypothetical protein
MPRTILKKGQRQKKVKHYPLCKFIGIFIFSLIFYLHTIISNFHNN